MDSWKCCVSLVLISATIFVSSVRAQSPSESTLTNAAQLATWFAQEEVAYPLAWLWEPTHFEANTIWWSDFAAPPKELCAIQDFSALTLYGVNA
jgi:hypothetical protein